MSDSRAWKGKIQDKLGISCGVRKQGSAKRKKKKKDEGMPRDIGFSLNVVSMAKMEQSERKN